MSRIRRLSSTDVLIVGALSLLLGLTAISRLHSYDEPADWDIATYAVIGHELDLGKSLYSDIWEMKLPPVYLSYALAERITGYGLGEIYLLAVLTTCATTLGVWYAASTAGPVAGLVAATAFTIVAGDYHLAGNRANTESFVNVLIVWGVAMVIRSDARASRWRIVIAGLLFGLASLYKQFAVAPAFMVLLAHVLRPGDGRTRRTALRQAAAAAGIMIGLWAATFGYFVATGRGRLFWITAVVFPHYYAGPTLWNLVVSLHPAHLFPGILYPLLPSAMLTAAAIAWPHWMRRWRSRPWAILVALIVGTQLAIGMLDRFSVHYYQLWFVPLSIGAGWGAVSLRQRLAAGRFRWLGPAAIATALAGALWIQLPAYAISAAQWSTEKNGIYHTWGQRVGRELDALLPPGETFFDWSENNPWLYFVARRRPIGPGLWRGQVTDGPLKELLTQQTLARLKTHPPPYVVEWAFHDPNDQNAISRWIWANYEPLPDDPPRWPLVLMRRKDPSP